MEAQVAAAREDARASVGIPTAGATPFVAELGGTVFIPLNAVLVYAGPSKSGVFRNLQVGLRVIDYGRIVPGRSAVDRCILDVVGEDAGLPFCAIARGWTTRTVRIGCAQAAACGALSAANEIDLKKYSAFVHMTEEVE